MNHTSTLVTLYAVLLLIAGLALLFVPHWFGTTMDVPESGSSLFAQLVGAAFIGFAASNWISRHALLGGIYGRAVVFGNQAFAVVGVLVMLGNIQADVPFTFWLLAVFAAGAVLHGTLLFRRPREVKSR